jgi:hypothetical protein
MAIRTKRLTNGLLLKPCSASSVSSLDKLKNGNLINGLIFIDSSDQRLKIQIENQERQILTTSQSQVITNKTISTNDNTIQVSASGIVSTELDAALAEIRMLIDDTSGSEVEIFNSTITIGSTAPSVTGIMYHKATDDIAFKKANIQIFGKNNVYDGVLQMDCKVGNIPDEYMQSMFSPVTTPTIKFVVAENDTVFNSITNTYVSGAPTKIIEQIINSEKKYILIGSFNFNGDSTKKNIIRLNSDGTEDVVFTENATRTLNSPNFNSFISDVVVENNGTLLVAGGFSNFKNSGINCLVRLNDDGSFNQNDPFNVNMVGKFTIDIAANIQEYCLKVKFNQNNIFYIKNKYVSSNNYTKDIIKIDNSGILDTLFVPISVPNQQAIYDFALTSLHIYAVGEFTNYGGSIGLNDAARFNIGNGSIDGNFTAAISNKFTSNGSNPTPFISGVIVQNDGKILFNGSFNYNSITGFDDVVRLNTDLTVDDIFKNNVLNKFTTCDVLILQEDNKLVLKGTYNGVTGIWRLNSDGSEDKAFNYFTKNTISNPTQIDCLNVFGTELLYSTKTTVIGSFDRILIKVINYPERYNEYMQATRTNEDGFVISTLNDGQFVRLDISNIPTGYVGTIQVVLTGVKIL